METNMRTFDITCTATLRPELLRTTLNSFNKYLFGKYAEKGRLIINVDMVGNDNPDFAKVQIYNILKKMPYRQKVVNFSKKPNFPLAFQWCMSKLSNKYVFHLEEDWELLFHIGFENMIKFMDKYENLAHLRLSQFKSNTRCIKTWQNHAYWNGEFFEYDDTVKQIDGWAGHPSINRSSFMIAACRLMNPAANPEKQISGRLSMDMHELIKRRRFGLFHYQNHSGAVRDLGRDWMARNGYVKDGRNKAWFTHWKKNEEK